MYPINHAWDDYYEMLESIRMSGITNMWGASPYLAALARISRKLAEKVLLSWISNYNELHAQLSW